MLFTPGASLMITELPSIQRRSGRMALALALLVIEANASAGNNVLIEACNGMKNAAKRAECLKAAKELPVPAATSKAPTPAVPDTPPPFSLDVAATICETIYTKMIPRHAEATIDESSSDEKTMQVTWPGKDGSQPVYCGVDRQSRKIVSIGKGDKALKGEELAKRMSEHENNMKLQKEMAEGNYKNFVAQAKQALTRDFKDPASAQYRNLFISGTHSPVLCGEVNAKNSYGAYIGYQRFYATTVALLTKVDNEKEHYVFERMHPTMCGEKITEIAE